MDNLVKFSRKYNQADFNNLSTKDADTLYFIKDTGKIYLGSTLKAESNSVSSVNSKTGAVSVKEANNFMHVNYIDNDGSVSQVAYAPCTSDNTDASNSLQEITFDGLQFSGNLSNANHVLTLTLNTVNAKNYKDEHSANYIVTKSWLDSELTSKIAASDAMVFKGTLGTGGTKTTLPTNNITVGDTYKVITAGGYGFGNSSQGNAGTINVKVGDLVVALKSIPSTGTADANTWIVIPSGDEAVTTIQIADGQSNVNNNAQTGTIKLGSVVTKKAVTSITGSTSNPTNYTATDTNVPTAKAVYDLYNTLNNKIDETVNQIGEVLDEKINTSDIVTSISSSNPSSTKVLSEVSITPHLMAYSQLNATFNSFKYNAEQNINGISHNLSELTKNVQANTAALTWD